jgi:hypothetical protein
MTQSLSEVAASTGCKYIVRVAHAADTLETTATLGFATRRQAHIAALLACGGWDGLVAFVYTVNKKYVNRQHAFVDGQKRDLVHLRGLTDDNEMTSHTMREVVSMTCDEYKLWHTQTNRYQRVERQRPKEVRNEYPDKAS